MSLIYDQIAYPKTSFSKQGNHIFIIDNANVFAKNVHNFHVSFTFWDLATKNAWNFVQHNRVLYFCFIDFLRQHGPKLHAVNHSR